MSIWWSWLLWNVKWVVLHIDLVIVVVMVCWFGCVSGFERDWKLSFRVTYSKILVLIDRMVLHLYWSFRGGSILDTLMVYSVMDRCYLVHWKLGFLFKNSMICLTWSYCYYILVGSMLMWLCCKLGFVTLGTSQEDFAIGILLWDVASYS